MKKTKSRIVFEWINYIILFFVAMLCLYPIIYVVFASVSRSSLLMQHSGLLLKPLDFNLDSYLSVFRTDKIISGYKNTMKILIIGVSLNMFLTICAAYFFTRKDIMLQKLLMFLIIVTMFFSGGLIPVYLNVCEIGIDNTLWAVILPSAVSTFNLIILKNAFASIPDELEEAAMIDGANDLTVLFRIIVPVSKASLAVILLYYLVGHWNSWFNAMIFLRDDSLHPLQLVMRDILLANQTDSMLGSGVDAEGVSETIKYAVICVSTIPVLIVYPFLQKYFVGGVMVGAVKG